MAGVFDGTEQKIGTALYQVSWTSDGEIERIQFDTMLCYRERHPEQKYGDGTADHLVQVGETFWLGSPDFSRLTFLSPTEPSKVVYDIQVPDPLTPALYDQVDWSNRRNRFELFNKNGMVHDIQTFSNLILVKVGALGYVPFDPDGTQLAEHRIRANMSTLKDVYEETGLFITNRKYVLFLEEHIGRTIRIPSDYDREDEEQPFVVLTRLKPDFR
ncbi:hypothetical protein [Acanthopleuribacter pedis]|uniref:hypothetical protein n=1 Tax=Acanthopleuribacter pedis TaxID=442870 RepID=UPI001FB00F67|nr:hypothetical protein [Acanthopleuribacter pedis]